MPPRGRAPIAAALVAVAWLVGCAREPSDKIVGWPPREPIVPLRDVVEDAAPEVVADTEAPDAAADDAPEVAEEPPCHQLVDLVCELQGRFTDACREAKTNVPDDAHPETREACRVLLADFVEREVPRLGSACARYAREVCTTLGAASEPCKTAQGQIAVLTTRRELRACLGDLLWIRTRTFRR